MTLGEWVGLGTSVVLAAISIWKHLKVKDYRGALAATIDGIEHIGKTSPEAGQLVKSAVKDFSVLGGVGDFLHEVVKDRTEGKAPTAPPVAGALLVLLLPVLALQGCSAFGAPPKEETLGARVALDRLDAALVLADTTWEANTRAFAGELERAANAETDQAVMDDLRKLQMDGKLNQEAVRELYIWSAETKARDAVDIRGALDKALGTRSRAELKEVWAKVRTYWAARLDADALRADTEAQLRGLLEKSGIQLPGSVDRLFTPRELKPATAPAGTPHE